MRKWHISNGYIRILLIGEKGRQDGDLEISYLISDEKTGGIMDLFLAFKKLATDMDWQDDNVIFTDRSGETIRFIETIADSDRDSYTIKGRKTGLIIF